MTVALSEVYWYFAVDTDHDVSGDDMEFSLDTATWVTGFYAAPSTAAQDSILDTHPVPEGYTRYWWRALSGEGNDLPYQQGKQFVYGRLHDSPQTPVFKWYVNVPI